MAEESSSSVKTTPRLKREIRDETSEVLGTFEASRLTREEKTRLEAELSAKGGEVDFFERAWRKTTFHSLTEIESEVDRLAARSITGAPPSAAFAVRKEATEGAQRVVSRAYDKPMAKQYPMRVLTAHERGHISAHLDAQILKADVKYRTSQGEVVEVVYEKDGEEVKTIVIMAGEKVRTIDEITAEVDDRRIDEDRLGRLPTREGGSLAGLGAPAGPEPPAASDADISLEISEPAGPSATEGSGAMTVSEAPPEVPSGSARPTPAKKLGVPKMSLPFGKKKAQAEPSAPVEGPTEEAAVGETPPTGEKRRLAVPKVKLPFGKKKAPNQEPPVVESGIDEATSDEPGEEPGKKRLGGLFKKKG
ncbi:MAG: hypothetical protein HY556_03495 [Euryarchaeota archaeon]|nr:hypothetical protein [Euryarchaeota archaeon]